MTQQQMHSEGKFNPVDGSEQRDVSSQGATFTRQELLALLGGQTGEPLSIIDRGQAVLVSLAQATGINPSFPEWFTERGNILEVTEDDLDVTLRSEVVDCHTLNK